MKRLKCKVKRSLPLDQVWTKSIHEGFNACQHVFLKSCFQMWSVRVVMSTQIPLYNCAKMSSLTTLIKHQISLWSVEMYVRKWSQQVMFSIDLETLSHRQGHCKRYKMVEFNSAHMYAMYEKYWKQNLHIMFNLKFFFHKRWLAG